MMPAAMIPVYAANKPARHTAAILAHPLQWPPGRTP